MRCPPLRADLRPSRIGSAGDEDAEPSVMLRTKSENSWRMDLNLIGCLERPRASLAT
jgi:hypothetical protein